MELKIAKGILSLGKKKKKTKSITDMTKEEKAALLKKYQDETGLKTSYGDKDKRLIPILTNKLLKTAFVLINQWLFLFFNNFRFLSKFYANLH